MLYQRPKFTCPAASQQTSQEKWDLAMLTKEEFVRKYGQTKYEILTGTN